MDHKQITASMYVYLSPTLLFDAGEKFRRTPGGLRQWIDSISTSKAAWILPFDFYCTSSP